MTDSPQPVALDLESEATSAPVRELPYVSEGASAGVVGGAQVFFSRNRKAKAAKGEAAPLFLTCEEGTSQQSIPYRAIAAALTHDVIPMAQVVTRYRKSGRIAELVALLTPEELPTTPVPATQKGASK